MRARLFRVVRSVILVVFPVTVLLFHTRFFRTCIFQPCSLVLEFSVLVFSTRTHFAILYFSFPYLHFPVLAISAPPLVLVAKYSRASVIAANDSRVEHVVLRRDAMTQQ